MPDNMETLELDAGEMYTLSIALDAAAKSRLATDLYPTDPDRISRLSAKIDKAFVTFFMGSTYFPDIESRFTMTRHTRLIAPE